MRIRPAGDPDGTSLWISSLRSSPVSVTIRAGAALADAFVMCDDVEAEVTRLKSKGVQCFPPAKEDWGIRTGFALPSGAIVGMYQPLHKSALNL